MNVTEKHFFKDCDEIFTVKQDIFVDDYLGNCILAGDALNYTPLAEVDLTFNADFYEDVYYLRLINALLDSSPVIHVESESLYESKEIFDIYYINNFEDKGFYINQITNAVVSSFTVKWMFQGRFIKDLFIKCDSTVHLNSWYAVIEPPLYSSMNRYTTKDTIDVLLGSKIELVLKGVLTNQLRINVPRETLLSNRKFKLEEKIKSFDLVFKNLVFTIPVKIKEDLPPVIEVQSNTTDSLSLFIYDDFGVKSIMINEVQVGNNNQFIIYWNSDDEIIVKAFDQINQITVKTIKKPQPSFNELNSTISKNTKPVLTSFKEIKEQKVLNKDLLKLF